MLYKDIKVGGIYKTRSLLQEVKVKVIEKKRTESFYTVKYEYIDAQLFGCKIGLGFSETKEFKNISAVE